MRLAEALLYYTARHLANSERTTEHKAAVRSPDVYDAQRAREFTRITEALTRYAIPISGRVLCDLGCGDAAITHCYRALNPAAVIGVDVDERALARARDLHPELQFARGTASLPDRCVDVIVSYDVFEHIAEPLAVLRECGRVLRPGGQMLIGTWGWRHPFAPHLWATMPVPWAHCLVSEKTLLRACKRVYESPWYQPTMHDVGPNGERLPGKYQDTSIARTYLNHYLLRDFRRAFLASGLTLSRFDLVPFASASWTRPLLTVPFIREFLTGYLWAVLTAP